MPAPGMSKKPLGGVLGGIPDDTIEKLKDQMTDVGDALKNLVGGDDDQSGGESGDGDSIAELQDLASSDPAKLAQKAQQQGLTPQQLLEKRRKEQEHMAAIRRRMNEMQQESTDVRQGEKEKEEKKKQEESLHQQEIVQLQEQQAKAEEKAQVLQSPSKKTPSRGSAFVVQKAKQDMMAERRSTPST